MNAREDAIRRNSQTVPVMKPSPSGSPSAPPGERGGQGTVGDNEVKWIGKPQSSEQYYAPGGQGQTNLNISNPAYPNYVGPPVDTGDGGDGDGGIGVGTDTGSGSSGGSGYKDGMSGAELAAFHNAVTGGNVLGTKLGGHYNMGSWLSQATLGGSDPRTKENFEILEGEEINTTPTIKMGDPAQLIGGEGTTGLQYNVKKPNEISYDFENLGSLSGNVSTDGFGINYSIPTNKLFNIFKAQGGPVGLMSLPQGYAAGGEVDPSDWRVIQQIIAAGGNPEDYVSYENGGEVIEGTDTMEELTPFGGTRERVIDQVEAFDNAPHHIEEPMIGMYGEKIPLTTARRVQKYMEGMDPVKRGLIEEMMQMFSMKNMMRKHQEQQETGQFFGPQPKEYDI